MRLSNGTRVRTLVVPDPPTDWTEEAKRARRFDVDGTVIAMHDSHGLCYEVRHDDGTVGAYEPRELLDLDLDQALEELLS